MPPKYDCENPFTAVWDALWTMAEANENLTDLVRKTNRIKYDDTIGPKNSITEGDLPELSLRSAGADINIRSNSTSSKLTHRYTWGMATGEYDINKYYNCVVWELYRAMFDWDTTLCSLEWPSGSGWNYVTNVQIATLDEGTGMVDEQRGIYGWAGMLQLDVEMHFRITDVSVN